jgi:hypothetical protein
MKSTIVGISATGDVVISDSYIVRNSVSDVAIAGGNINQGALVCLCSNTE